MIGWAVAFLITALVGAVLGLTGLAGAATNVAWLIFVLGLILAVVFALFGGTQPDYDNAAVRAARRKQVADARAVYLLELQSGNAYHKVNGPTATQAQNVSRTEAVQESWRKAYSKPTLHQTAHSDLVTGAIVGATLHATLSDPAPSAHHSAPDSHSASHCDTGSSYDGGSYDSGGSCDSGSGGGD